MSIRRFFRKTALLHSIALALALSAGPLAAREGVPPLTLTDNAKLGVDIPLHIARGIDAAARRAESDRIAAHAGRYDKRQRVADLEELAISPATQGRWDSSTDGRRIWRLRVRAPGATDLRLAFDQVALPRGSRLYVIGADDYYQGPYTRADVQEGRFFAPVVPGDTVTIELQIPGQSAAGSAAPLRVRSVGAGFRDVFGRSKASTGPGASGSCNVNVVCPLGQPYPDQIRAVGHYEFNTDGGTYICTGTLLADVPHDKKNYFLTAAHCISQPAEAQSMIVYWNYQSTQCSYLSAPAGGYYKDDQHGATLRATRADTDFTLVEMNSNPDPAWNLYYAGWDASGTAPSGTIGIHHPSGDAKKITAGPQPSTTDNCISDASYSNTHWETGPYSQGTTEGGSSGSALFSIAGNSQGPSGRVIGTLSGGSALCSETAPTQPNNGTDCYGKFSVSWSGSGNSAANRLREWLDPANTGTLSIDGVDQNAVTPTGNGHSRHAIPADFDARIPGH